MLVPPIHQKRLLAFVNNFIADTVEFLANLSTDCDIKFVACETKLRRIEDTLAIVEAKLSSVPELQIAIKSETLVEETPQTTTSMTQEAPVEVFPKTEVDVPDSVQVQAQDDYRYKKFFKMIRYGVHLQAVKDKLAMEGLDPNIIDNPTQILGDGQRTPPPDPSDDDEDSS